MKQNASYKNLIVYQKAKGLSVDICKYFSNCKYPRVLEFIILQLMRASTSVAANIAEGYGRYYGKSYRNFLSIARGSSFEVEHWLEFIVELNRFDRKTLEIFCNENQQISKILTTMVRNLERSRQRLS